MKPLTATCFLLLLVLPGCTAPAPVRDQPDASADATQAWVVIADIDSGANLLHPAFRRATAEHPSRFLPDYPESSRSLDVTPETTWEEAVKANAQAFASLRGSTDLFWIPGTKFVGLRADPRDESPVFHPRGSLNVHGARTTSQVAGDNYSYAPEAWLASFDTQVDRPDDPLPPGANVPASVFETAGNWFRFAADQAWIDVLHVALWNPHPLAPHLPAPAGSYYAFAGLSDSVNYAIGKGKFVAAAIGNTHGYDSQWNSWSGPPGVLAVGANDNCGWYDSSGHWPDVVMDGGDTRAAQTGGFGDSLFGGTSGASSLAAGYAAHLVYEARDAFGHDPSKPGALVAIPDGTLRPTQGPLADGVLTNFELHEVIRKTADPKSHVSRFDGGQRGCNAEQNQTSDPREVYKHMGYGEISEITLPRATAVLLGQEPMPRRSEDPYFAEVMQQRNLLWSPPTD